MHPNGKLPKDDPNSPIKVEDLPVEDGKDADIKGGPIYMPIDGVKGNSPRGP